MNERSHLKRLHVVWDKHPVYFITTCTAERRPLLANEAAHEILHAEWCSLHERHGWQVGRYIVMPDHVHFFTAPALGSAKPLSLAIGKWKEWTAKRLVAAQSVRTPVWQPEFFDHVLRSERSRAEKWAYMRENPVRAKLVERAEDWPYAGSVHFE